MLHDAIAFAVARGWERTWLLVAASSFLAGVFTMSAHAQSASAWIELKPLSGNVVQVTGHALALDAVTGLDFSLSLRRQSKGNTSSSRQAGRFDLEASQSKVLSTASINVEPGDDLVIELKLLDHGQEVASAAVSSRSVPSGGPRL